MEFTFHIKNRDDFIAFAQAVGTFVRDKAEKAQTFIIFGGDEGSGKELLSLGIDTVFNPANYPEGKILPYMQAEKKLGAEFNSHGVVMFENARRLVYTSREAFDRGLRDYKARNPNAKVLCYSNIARGITGEHDFAKKGMDSSELDISIRVYKHGDAQEKSSFERRVVVNLQDHSPFALSFGKLVREPRFAELSELFLRLSDTGNNNKNYPKP